MFDGSTTFANSQFFFLCKFIFFIVSYVFLPCERFIFLYCHLWLNVNLFFCHHCFPLPSDHFPSILCRSPPLAFGSTLSLFLAFRQILPLLAFGSFPSFFLPFDKFCLRVIPLLFLALRHISYKLAIGLFPLVLLPFGKFPLRLLLGRIPLFSCLSANFPFV